jgi:hypothetical protein
VANIAKLEKTAEKVASEILLAQKNFVKKAIVLISRLEAGRAKGWKEIEMN